MTIVTSRLGHAALLRAAVTVNSDIVRLSDLFTGLSYGQDQPLGPAPLPGHSYRVGGRQLIAIADSYGVDWLDQSLAAQIVVSRATRILDQAYFSKLISDHLAASQDTPLLIEFDDFHTMMVAANNKNPVRLTDVSWDKKTGHFTATVYRTRPTGDVTLDSFILRGFIKPAVPILVFTHPMSAGMPITQGDVRLDGSYEKIEAGLKAYTNESDIDGMLLVRNVDEGKPVLKRDLQRHVVLQKGNPVLITFTSPGLRLTATGRAMDDGSRGQFVRVLNVGNKMVLTGRVENSSEVTVDRTSSPVPLNVRLPRDIHVTSHGGQSLGFPQR